MIKESGIPQIEQSGIKTTPDNALVVPHNVEEKKEEYNAQEWTTTDVDRIYELEQKNWPVWLQRPKNDIQTIAERFSKIQLLLKNEQGFIAGVMTANRINYDPSVQLTWDTIARGEINDSQNDYTKTYKIDGNALCALSISVDTSIHGQRLGAHLFKEFIELAKRTEGVTDVLAPVRPTGYGRAKQTFIQVGLPLPEFKEYCAGKRSDGVTPADSWIRSVSQSGMQPVEVIEHSMIVPLTIDEIVEYRGKEIERAQLNESTIPTWIRTPYGIETGDTGSIYILKKLFAEETLEQVIKRQPKIEGEVFPQLPEVDLREIASIDQDQYCAYYSEQNFLYRMSV